MEELFGVPMDSIMIGLLAIFLPVLAFIGLMALRSRVMLKLGLRNIPRRRAQSVLIIVGIMISTLIMAAAFGTGDTITFSIRKAAVDALGTIDEIVVSARANAADSLGSSTYVPFERFTLLQQELAGFDTIDGLAPGIGEFAPTVNSRTSLSEGQMRIAGVDTDTLDGFGRFRLESGVDVRLEDLARDEAYINEKAAEELEAVAGDELITFVDGVGVPFRVKGVVDQGGLAGDESTLLVRLDRAQSMFGREGEINSIIVSNRGDEFGGAELSDEVTSALRVLFTDREIAAQLKAQLARPEVIQELVLIESGLSEDLLSDVELLRRELQSPGLSDELLAVLADDDVRDEVLDAVENTGLQDLNREVNTLLASLGEFRVIDIKQQILDQADEAGSGVTSFFVVMGLFSIMVGVLLIFLIFVMLAAARRSEMGMARAIGAKRWHLVQMFVFEGTAYSLVSGAVGVVLGLGASALIVIVANQIFAGGTGGGADEDFQLTRHFELRSAVVAYCLGMVITFATVGISAYRVSRLNIVAAVRGLPPPPDTTNAKLRDVLMAPLRSAVRPAGLAASSVGAVATLEVGRAAGLLGQAGWAAVTAPIAIFGGVLQILWRPFTQGWLAIIIGVLLTWSGTANDSTAPFTIGFTIAIIGVGLTIRTILRRAGVRADIGDRVGYTFMGVVVLIFWIIPFDALEPIFGETEGGIEMFFVSGIAMVAAAVWTVMYNADLLLKVLTFVTGRFGQLRPVLVPAVAYPMSAKFRTGLTLAMFALVIFTLIVMSILTEAFSTAAGDVDAVAGGWDIQAEVNLNTPIDDIRLAIDENPNLRNDDFEAIGGYTTFPVQARQLDADEQRWLFYAVRAADDEFLANTESNLKLIADGYGETAEDVWEAMRLDPNLVVVDSMVVPSRSGFAEDNIPFALEGVYYEDDTMEAIDIEVREPRTGEVVPLKVIGVLDRLSDAFGELGLGMLVSRTELDEAIPFSIPTTTYRFRVAEGADVDRLSRDLESGFRENGMESDSLEQLVEDQAAANRAFNYLFTGFMGLGLLVGIAALGVVSLRAVVERRQQIGVLRAIGYRRRMVQFSFLTESSFVVLMGVAIGVGLGTIISYNIVKDIQDEIETVRFTIPWLQIVIIVAIAYVFALATTFLPARQASRIYPAEALRYE
jgi:putative ABC transport system permease protein